MNARHKKVYSDTSSDLDAENEGSVVFGSFIKHVRDSLDISQREFGVRLQRVLKRDKPYTRSYISGLENGLENITPGIKAATHAIYAQVRDDDAPPFMNTQIQTLPGQVKPGALYSGESILCKWDDCRQPFIKTSPRQLQCPRCARERK